MIDEPTSEVSRQLEERLRFETLIADLSSRFLNLPANRVDREIEDAQRAICECLGVDHSSFWQGSQDDPHLLVMTHIQRDPALPPVPRLVGRDSFPWAQAKILAKEIVYVPDTDDVPPEAARDKESWHQYGIKSTLGIPLSVGGGAVIGVLSFDATDEED